ncbi:MAG: hypothetical protein ACE5HE_12360 [Phycisphaerae bacterium]
MRTDAAVASVAFMAFMMCAMGGCASSSVSSELVYFPASPGTPRVVHLKSFNSLADLVRLRSRWADVFRGRPASPYVSTPAGIAYHNGHLYICDTGLNVVHDWNLISGEASRIGLSGDIMLGKPVAVAVGSEGRHDGLGDTAPLSTPIIYVADAAGGQVVAFTSEGTPIARYNPEKRSRYKPVAVAVYASTLYVADLASHGVDIFSVATGELTGSIGTVGSAPGKFYFPMGLAVDADGKLFVSDMMNARVQVFDQSGSLQRTMGQPGDRYGDMGKPKHLSVGPDRTIFIADSEFAHIHLFDSEGRLLLLIGGPEDTPGGTPMPLGVATASTLPERLAALVPSDFSARYFLFTTNTIASKRISLFAVGSGR